MAKTLKEMQERYLKRVKGNSKGAKKYNIRVQNIKGGKNTAPCPLY